MVSREEATTYLVDYVYCAVTFLEEVEDGYIFSFTDDIEGSGKVKVFKEGRLDYYQVLA